MPDGIYLLPFSLICISDFTMIARQIVGVNQWNGQLYKKWSSEMRKILQRITTIALAAGLCLSAILTAHSYDTREEMIRVGLAYGSGALTAAYLENNDGYGSGYRFGYFDGNLDFVEVGRTGADVTQITMLRASEIYYDGSNYTTVKPSGTYTTIGCYHVVLGTYGTYKAALAETANYENSFVAWINGSYQLRQGTYPTKEEALAAQESLGGQSVKGTSSYAVNVVETGSTKLLFQFDGGSGTPLGIMPDVTGKEEVRTWCKGYRYYGGFRYERVGGGNLTVVNVVDLETYIKGVLPYEMSNSWPLEALKAQAVCARSYAYNNLNEHKHSSYNFDICSTSDCQVYRGAGVSTGSYQSNSRTDQAVDETAGMFALYNNIPIVAYYASSHGGASERVDYVWSSSLSKYPYLCGVVDPYEKNVASINSYSSWTKTWTSAELTSRLQEKGYAAGTEVKSLDLTYTERGNAIKVQVNYTNGESQVFTPKMSWGLKSLLGVSSLHFTVNGQGVIPEDPETIEVLVNGTESMPLGGSVCVIGETGQVSKVSTGSLHVMTGSGNVSALKPESVSFYSDADGNTVVSVAASTYVLEGAGNGHQLGMSQYGANAMAKEGFAYDDIVEFYYPGVKVGGL